MNESRNEESAARLLNETRWMPNSETKLQLLERAVRLADAENDEELAFDARLELAETAAMTHDSNKRLVAFAWCLSRFEQQPERYTQDVYMLLWWFKGVADNMAEFPRISREEIDQVQTRMQRLFEQHGYSPRPIYASMLDVAIQFGDLAEADRLFELWANEPRDSMTDCPACETNQAVEYYVLRERYDDAFRAAEPNLDGRQQCGSGDSLQRTVVQLLRPLVLRDKADEADALQQRAYRLLRRPTTSLPQAAHHVAYLANRDSRVKGLNTVERFLARALQPPSPDQQARFYLASRSLMRKLAATGRPRKMKLPKTFPLYDESGSYQPAALAEWFDVETRQLLEQFDRRNGNDFFSRELPQRYAY